MSQYFPDPQKMYVREVDAGWLVYDAHGVYDGPYKSERDALSIIVNARIDLEGEDTTFDKPSAERVA